MGRRNRDNRGVLIPFLALVAFYVSGLFSGVEPVTMEPSLLLESVFRWSNLESSKTISAILAFSLILINSIILFVLHQSFSTVRSIYTPIIYIILVSSNPHALFFTPLHIASTLIIIFLYCSLSIFNATDDEQRIETLIASILSLSIASFFFPPLIWLYIVAFLLNFFESEAKLKYIVAFMIGIIIPMAAIFGIFYMIYSAEKGFSLFQELWSRGIAIPEKSIIFTMTDIVKFTVISVGLITSLIVLLKSMGTYGSRRYRSYIRIIILLVGIVAISLIFGGSTEHPFGLLFAVPTAMLLNDFIETPLANRFKSTYLIAAFLVLLIERLSYFL